MTPFPAPNRLHVWWARRPLVASRAAILASLLPADADHGNFLRALGIHGDPVASRQRLDQARRRGERFEGEAYSYRRAFTYTPDGRDNAWFTAERTKLALGRPVVLDPTAGGGSIPFEAVRVGADAIANDLNPVAALILKATVELPLRHRTNLVEAYRTLADRFVTMRELRLATLFPSEPLPNCIPTNYIWARTVRCPQCDGLVPLSPNWRLGPGGLGVRVVPDSRTRFCTFDIVARERDQSQGSVARGAARCPYLDCGRVIANDELKRLAQAGGMGDQMFAVVYKKRVCKRTKTGKSRETWEKCYRAAAPDDDVSQQVEARLAEKLPEWEALDIVPGELLPMDTESWTHGNTPAQYGVKRFTDLFSPRQLLGHGYGVEVFRELLDDHHSANRLGDLEKAAFCYLALSLDKARDYNSRMTRWHSTREVVANTFDRHDFAFKWSYAEIVPLIVGLGYDWGVDQTAKCMEELVQLTHRGIGHLSASPRTVAVASQDGLFGNTGKQEVLFADSTSESSAVTVTCNSGDTLVDVADASVDAVVMDPPYSANVMYSELSDFFYVWLKRTAGYVYPELFRRQLTDKEHEAVANVARFQNEARSAEVAEREYRSRMSSIFAECRRVLKPDGILTVMFTHKDTGAWDALTSGLMEAGFRITASWPVNTESEGSLHIRNKAAANSTIFLACRPRPVPGDGASAYWEEVEPQVAAAVRQRVAEFEAAGIHGVDLYLSCFGPALEEFSKHWPLKRGQPRPTRAPSRRRKAIDVDPYVVTSEDALDAARREVKRHRLDKLLRVHRQTELDALTEWFVLAWDAFKAPSFPYDEALRLARVVGLDLDADVVEHLAEKDGANLLLWDSSTRAASGGLGPPDGSRALLDALHHAAHRARTVGLQAARELLENSGAAKLTGFPAALAAVLEVLPVSSAFTHVEGEEGAVAASASDFEVLENLRRLAYTERVAQPEQLKFWTEDVK